MPSTPTSISLSTYAILAGAAYNAIKGKGNTIPDGNLPLGWEKLPDYSQSDRSTSGPTSGFGATTYKNGSNIVISYEGTDFLNDPVTGKLSGATIKDGLADLALGLGIGSQQAIEAAQLYEDVLLEYPADEGYTITFTGHSLGAGLASMMSVWFNVPATVFDDAPFLATAQNTAFAQNVSNALPYHDPALTDFLNQSVLGSDQGLRTKPR